jgi:hypothetical protein
MEAVIVDPSLSISEGGIASIGIGKRCMGVPPGSGSGEEK